MAEAFFPYSKLNLVTGPIRVVAAKRSALGALPVKPSDILGQVSPYTLVSPYIDFGAAVNPGSYSTGNTQSDLTIEQDTVAVGTDITEVTRSLQFNIAEFSPAALAIVEQSPGVETLAAVSGSSAFKRVPLGSYSDVDKYCVAFIGRRRKEAGLVTEPGGATRGRMVIVLLYNASITGDAKSAQFAKGALSGMDVTFQGYPDSAAASGKDHGDWWAEDAGTIA
jgi:hypothetical protein